MGRRLQDNEPTTQLNAYIQTPAEIYESSKLVLVSQKFYNQMSVATTSALGTNQTAIVQTPLTFFSQVKDMPIEDTWTTSTGTTSTMPTSTSSIIIMPGAQTPAPSTTTTTTTLYQGNGSGWIWLLLLQIFCLLAVVSFLAFRMYSKHKGPDKGKRDIENFLPPPEEHKPLMQTADQPPPPPPVPMMTPPSLRAPVLTTAAPPVYTALP